MKYILSIDQSTQSTKAFIVDVNGRILIRCERAHKQIVDENGFVSHDTEEIYRNVIALVAEATEKSGVNKRDIAAVGICNQRETTVLFDTNGALANAVVWQCSRGKEITDVLSDAAATVRKKSGLLLSPYFPAAKMAWLLKYVKPVAPFMLGTIDSWLVYRLTGNFYTDYSNASRTQLFNIDTLSWDEELCALFGVPMSCLPEVKDSDGYYGSSDFDGYFDTPIPICAVLGDSHSALYAHGCFDKGDVKATYGTGSSVMMNVGPSYRTSEHGLSASLAWKLNGKVDYILEGNINYSAAVVSWLQNDLRLISSPSETEAAALSANPADTTVLVPAFSGLSAPYWNSSAKAAVFGMSRVTGKNELIRACLDSVAFQVNDVLSAMTADSGLSVKELYTDGGASHNRYLMQLQSDLGRVNVNVPQATDFSALGVAYIAGKCIGMHPCVDNGVVYTSRMSDKERANKLNLWSDALAQVMNKR